mmetsp:Transcript_8143/g.23021  ORF Transcript_8143/g.23021 Transcript_8143/m.23021 type:complete len:171 (+) Transcript_8143:84-596(+)
MDTLESSALEVAEKLAEAIRTSTFDEHWLQGLESQKLLHRTEEDFRRWAEIFARFFMTRLEFAASSELPVGDRIRMMHNMHDVFKTLKLRKLMLAAHYKIVDMEECAGAGLNFSHRQWISLATRYEYYVRPACGARSGERPSDGSWLRPALTCGSSNDGLISRDSTTMRR